MSEHGSGAISPWALGPRTLGPRTLSTEYFKSQGPEGRGPKIQTSIKVESAWEPPQKCLGKRVFCNNHIAATKQRKLQQNGIKVA